MPRLLGGDPLGVSTVTASSGNDRALKRGEKHVLVVLGLPAFGLAAAITTVSTSLPVVANQFTGSRTVIGLLIAAEGVLALFLPLVIGSWSDRLRTPIGGRLPFVLAGVPLMAIALALMGLADGLAVMAVSVVLFFVAYFVAYEPYRALYPDLAADEIAGRAQSGQAAARGLGTAAALGLAGVLLSIGDAAPFAVSAVIVLAATALFAHLLLTRRMHAQTNGRARTSDPRSTWRDIKRMVREHRALKPYLVANALWELGLAAIKTFVVLYVTRGLGFSLAAASAIIGSTGVVILLAALASGRLADRYGTERVMRVALVLYGAGLFVPFATATPALILAALPLIAAGGGVLMALPYALLMPMMPEDEHGTVTGFYSMSRGVGVMLGPLLAGAAIDASLTPVADSRGYPAVWGVAGLAILASLPCLRAVERRSR